MSLLRHGDIILKGKIFYLVVYVNPTIKDRLCQKDKNEPEQNTVLVCINPSSGDPLKIAGINFGQVFGTLDEIAEAKITIVGNLQDMAKKALTENT